MTCNKFYIRAPAASGKSTFARQHPQFLGYEIIDFARHRPRPSVIRRIIVSLSRLGVRLRWLLPDSSKSYFDALSAFMLRHEGPVVVLGSRTPRLPEQIRGSTVTLSSLVLIPEADHRRNCRAREHERRAHFPFLPHWSTSFERIQRARDRLVRNAQQRDIPLYDSFPAAIRAMHRAHAEPPPPDTRQLMSRTT